MFQIAAGMALNQDVPGCSLGSNVICCSASEPTTSAASIRGKDIMGQDPRQRPWLLVVKFRKPGALPKVNKGETIIDLLLDYKPVGKTADRSKSKEMGTKGKKGKSGKEEKVPALLPAKDGAGDYIQIPSIEGDESSSFRYAD